MTGAVLFAAPGMAGRLVEVAAQLRAAGATRLYQVDGAEVAGNLRAAAELIRASAEPLLLCSADLVANDSVLRILATEPAARTYALISRSAPGAVSEERGRVTAVGGTGGAAFLGAMRIAVTDLPLVADCCQRAAEQAERAGGAATVAATGTAVDLLLAEMIAAKVAVLTSPVRLLHAERVRDPAALPAALAAVAAVNEDAARLRYAVKERDDFFTTYFVSSYSPYLTRWAARRGLSPATVTAASVGLAVLAAGAFAIASRPAMVAGALLLYAGFVLDCVDGQLARYTRRFSAFGGWLDTMADRAKEYVVYAGLAAGAASAGRPTAWWLAIAAMVLQTVRHTTDTWYGLLHDEAVARRAGSPSGEQDRGGLLGRVSDRVLADAGSLAYWLKRIVVFPIGERWATIALAAVLFNGRVALIVVLVWGGFAAAYTLALRSLRSIRMRVPVLTTADLPRQRDDGPLVRCLLGRAGRALAVSWFAKAWSATAPLATAVLAVLAAATLVVGQATVARAGWQPVVAAALVVLAAGLPAQASHAGGLDWLVPAALRAAEYLFVVGVGIAGEVPQPLIYALLFVLALQHYNLTARPGDMQRLGDLGWDGRLALLAATVPVGVTPSGFGVLAVYLGFFLAVRGVAGWTPRSDRPGRMYKADGLRTQRGGADLQRGALSAPLPQLDRQSGTSGPGGAAGR